MDEWITLKQAELILGIARRGVQSYIDRGKLASELRTSDFGVRYRVVRRGDVTALAESRLRMSGADRPSGISGRPPKTPIDGLR